MTGRLSGLLLAAAAAGVVPLGVAPVAGAVQADAPAETVAPDPQLAGAVALVEQAEALGNAEKFAEAVPIFDRAVAMLEAMPAGSARDAELAKALGMRSAAAGRLDRFDEAFAGSVALEERFGDHVDGKVREYVAMSMIVRGMMHDHRGDKDAALASWEQLTVRYGADPVVAVRALALTSAVMRMMTMNEQGRKADALALADETLAAVGEGAPAEIQQAALSIAMLRAAIGTEVAGKGAE